MVGVEFDMVCLGLAWHHVCKLSVQWVWCVRIHVCVCVCVCVHKAIMQSFLVYLANSMCRPDVPPSVTKLM